MAWLWQICFSHRASLIVRNLCFYQPLVDFKFRDKLLVPEALKRWQHPDLGATAP
jgi:predicted signal transduction protein with EAL and GGDEF domain